MCYISQFNKFLRNVPWLVWLSGLSASLWTKRLPVQFPVRACACIVGQVHSWGHARRQPINVSLSLSPSLPLSLKVNKILKKKKKRKEKKETISRLALPLGSMLDTFPFSLSFSHRRHLLNSKGPYELAARGGMGSSSSSWLNSWSCPQGPLSLTLQWADSSSALTHSFPVRFLQSQSSPA